MQKIKPGNTLEREEGWLEKTMINLLFFSVLTLTCFLHYQIKNYVLLHPNISVIPSFQEVYQNLGLLFQGYAQGYLRTIQGVTCFLLISSFFIFSGKLLINCIFNRKKRMEDDWESATLLERLSLYYLLGALFASLLWFVLGISGYLKPWVALALALGGFIGFLFQFLVSDWSRPSLVRTKIVIFLNRRTMTEKVALFIICIVMLLFSTSGFQNMVGDSLNVVTALPAYYLNEGKIVFNPYHFYTYFTQNTEMLMMWALLLKSEATMGLLIWGLLSALVFLMLGFSIRHKNWLAGLVSVLVLFSTGGIMTSLWVKPDLPCAVYLFAHYIAMIESLNKRSKPWVLLSGLLCGGAIGYKLVALPCALFSFLILLGHDLYHRAKPKSHTHLTLYWLLGCSVAVAPWFIRTFYETGDPIYPFLSNLLRRNISNPIYRNFYSKSFSFNNEGFAGIKEYLFNLLLWNNKICFYWGPTLLFSLSGIIFFTRSHPAGFKLSFLAAFISMIFFLRWLDPRYHLGLLIFLVCLPLIMSWQVKPQNFLSRARNYLTPIIALYILHQSYTVLFKNGAIETISMILSGNTPGNYKSTDDLADDIKLIHYLINTRTRGKGGILYADIYYIYGIKGGRKLIFSSGYHDSLTREPICDLAQNSNNSDDLFNKIINLGVENIIINSDFYQDMKNVLKTDEKDLAKIKDLIQNHAVLRFETPDGKILWYSFNLYQRFEPIEIDANDIRELPEIFLQYINKLIFTNKIAEAHRVYELAVKSPMTHQNKSEAFFLLSKIYLSSNDKDKAEGALISSIQNSPELPVGYLRLALFYDEIGHCDKASDMVQRAVNYNGKELLEYKSEYKILKKYYSFTGD